MAENLLNKTELATRLGVSTEQIRKMIRAKKITGGYKVGETQKYMLSEVLAQLATKTKEGDQQ